MNSSTSSMLKLVGIVASAALAFATGLIAGGARSEKQSSDTHVSISGGVEFSRKTYREVQEGDIRQESPTPIIVPKSPESSPTIKPVNSEQRTSYVGGNYVSGKSTMRYVLVDNNGDIEMYGYDVMRGQRVFVGSGKLVERRLIIPKFYSFLDNTYGTLKLDLSEDGKTFEGHFEGLNASQEGRVVLVRLP